MLFVYLFCLNCLLLVAMVACLPLGLCFDCIVIFTLSCLPSLSLSLSLCLSLSLSVSPPSLPPLILADTVCGSFALLKEAEVKLRTIIRTKLTEAVERRNKDDIER